MSYKAHLSKDKKLKKLVDTIELPELKVKKNIFIELVSSIASQQLSVKVAAVIFDRFLKLYNGKKPTPEQVIATPHEDLRGIGFSNQKVTYVKNIAQFAVEYDLSYAHVNKMSNEELIKYLTQIKGVGQWTVEMLMMFTLARADVFSVGDYGLQMGVKKLYKMDDTNKKPFLQEIEKLSKKWIPYRTYASLYLWRYKDGE
jgi:DNA-3-methyladenine glycosylase II